MIYVCDAIMGAGKSSAAITYMNERPHQKFIYVTPFKDETTRIQSACPELHFWTPGNLPEHEYMKREHFRYLVEIGMNIATTHANFSMCDEDALQLIRDKEYTVILDESISAMEKIQAKADDIKIAMESEWLHCENCDDGLIHEVTMADKEYNGDWLKNIRFYAKSRRLVALKNDEGEHRFYCWMLNSELFYVAKDTIILTYLFDSSPMSYLFQMNQIEYEPLYVDRDGDRYFFSNELHYMPEYTARLDQMIHICQNKRMNAIGNSHRALSINWTKEAVRRPGNGHAETLRKNVENYFRNIHRETAPNPQDRLWSCHTDLEPILRGKG